MARGELTVSVLFFVFVVVVFTKECVGRAYSFVFVVLPLNVSVELTRIPGFTTECVSRAYSFVFVVLPLNVSVELTCIPVLPLNVTVKLTRSYFWFYHRMCQ